MKQWELLKKQFELGSLSHAYILSGRDLKSLKEFSKDFVKFMNCLSNDFGEKSCGECENCKMIEKEIFPDLLLVKSADSKSSQKNKKDMMEISIEQIREARNFLSLKSYYGKFKSVIIEDAERMSIEAQNCFLKNLEEPKGESVVFLLTSKPVMILPTIFSRCQEIKLLSANENQFSKEEKLILDNFLKIIGSDLAEKFDYAKNADLEENNFGRMLDIFQRYFRNLLMGKITTNSNKPSYSVEQLKKIIRLIDNLNYQQITANTNKKLALEILLTEV